MKRITQTLLLLTIVSASLLSGCSTGSSIDQLVDFDSQGVAVLHGRITAGTTTLGKGEILYISIPAKMDGMDVEISIPFKVQRETIIASTTTKQTDVLEYQSFHTGASAYDAFPASAQVDVTFRKNNDAFIAISIVEVTKKSLFPSKPSVDSVFTMDGISRGTLQGHVFQTYSQQDGTVLWLVSAPVSMQGVQVGVTVPVQSAIDTDVVSTSGNIIMLDQVSGDVLIEFTRNRNTLTAKKITEIK